jgi:divalent metal cation (Fe/Co/Zn/Cd) transporter
MALAILGLTTLLQAAIYLFSGSVAMLADTMHNLGEALNSIPLWIAFALARMGQDSKSKTHRSLPTDLPPKYLPITMLD